jgi:hypothetical protein
MCSERAKSGEPGGGECNWRRVNRRKPSAAIKQEEIHVNHTDDPERRHAYPYGLLSAPIQRNLLVTSWTSAIVCRTACK